MCIFLLYFTAPAYAAFARFALYARLVGTADAEGYTGDIRWNFEKFLVSPSGEIVARFSPLVTPEAPELVDAIEGLLA